MGKNLTQISSTTTATNNDLMYVATPDGGNPYGFVDRAITKVNFIKEIRADVDANTEQIGFNEADIISIENKLGDNEYVDVTGLRIRDTEANAVVFYFVVKPASGTPTFKVGTSDGADDIVREWVGLSEMKVFRVDKAFEANTDMYIRSDNGTCGVLIVKTADIFNIV